MNIISRKEAKEQGLTRYFTGKPCKHGHIDERTTSSCICIGCNRILVSKHAAKEESKQKRKAYEQAFNRAPETKARKAKLDKRPEAKQKRLERQRKRMQDPAYRNAKNARTNARRAAKLQRTPAWSDLEAIKQIYLDRPEDHHVDHIIPLQGELVSGLHVPENLQHLPASENCSKNNAFDPMTFEG